MNLRLSDPTRPVGPFFSRPVRAAETSSGAGSVRQACTPHRVHRATSRPSWPCRIAMAAGALLLTACAAAPLPAERSLPRPVDSGTALISLPANFYPPAATAKAGLEQLTGAGIPRLRHLSAEERAVETRVAMTVERAPERALEGARRLATAAGSAAQPVFEVDAVKHLFEGYGIGRAPASPEEMRFRLTRNHALHPAAVAVARLAFIERLDALQSLPAGDPGRVIFVTGGGCAAGKGDLFSMARSTLGPDVRFGAIWDAAGEGNALENAWILAAARARGLAVVFGWAEADPAMRYDAVLARAALSGRVVDVLTFVDSYVQGGAVFRRFLESPEYRAAQAAGQATSFGVAPGDFDPASLVDRSKPAYPQARALNRLGEPLRPGNLAAPPDRLGSLQAALRVLETHLERARAAGRQTDDLLQGALGNTLKFLDEEPAAVRTLLLDAHARLASAGATLR